jgi:hypothetical protein
MRKRLLIAAIVATVAVAALVLGFCINRRSNAARLSEYLSQLRARGEKLTFAELATTPSTNREEVASRETFATTKFPEVQNLPVLMEFVGPGNARVAWRGNFYLPSTNDDAPNELERGDWKDLARENQQLAAQLQVFCDALKHSAPDTGWLYQDTLSNLVAYQTTNIIILRQVCQSLANAVLEDLHQTNIDLALSRLDNISALANLYRNDLALINVLVRARNTKAGLDATWETLQSPGLDQERLARLQRDWEAVKLLDGFERSILAQRSRVLVSMETIRNWKLREMVNGFTINDIANDGTLIRPSLKERLSLYLACANYKARWLDDDARRQLEYWTAMADAIRRLENGKPAGETISLMDAAYKQAYNDYSHMSTLHHMIGGFFAPGKLSDSLQRVIEVETQRRLTITAIAIMQYQLKHGAAPKGLNALVPDFLAAVPMDPMSGRPLCYRLNADGTFTLYSTGKDGKDDGGDGSPRDGGTKFGLWEGRDAVWPTVPVETNADMGTR